MNREAIAQALFTLLSSATIAGQPAFVTMDRNVALPGEQPQPAMYLGEPKETHLRKSEAVPDIVTLHFQVFIYTKPDDKTVPAARIQNNILDAIDAVLTPSAVIPGQPIVQTLGGLVSHAWIEGDVPKSPGYLDGQGLMLVPIGVLVPA